MAEYLIQGESLTALADEIRELSGTTAAMGLDAMATHVDEANDEVGSQANLIEQIVNALDGKGVAGGSEGYDEADSLITMDLSSYTNSRVSSIGRGAFAYGSNLKSVSFPAATTIGSSAFCYCSSLTTANFPQCTYIGSSAFYYCKSLTTASFPKCTSIGSNAFLSCTSLTTASFPKCTSMGSNVFRYCSRLTTVNFPAATTLSPYAFGSCSRLTTVNFPAATTLSACAFSGCSSLTTASFPKCSSIGSSAFCSCYNLARLYLAGSSICSLTNSNAFTSTPYAGYSSSFLGTPCIYVPSSLIATYQSATNWAYFSSYFSTIESLGDSGSEIITFTINGVVYQAEEGMTWSEWCDSSYNTDGFMMQITYIRNYSLYGGAVVCYNDGQTYVNCNIGNNSRIIFNYNYAITWA